MIIVIVGPTGVGKTKLSIELAKKYDAVVVNADAVQVYNELNIGSAKPTLNEKEGIQHFLFDIKSITEKYTVADYQKDLRNFLDSNKEKNIIIVGGTGLYVNAGLFDYQFNEDIDNKDYNNYTNDELYNLAKKKNSNMNIDKNNKQRLIRFLKKDSNDKSGNNLLYNAVFIGLTTPRDILYSNINKRVDLMIENGLIEEVKELYKYKDVSRVINSAIGYKEIIGYLDNLYTKEEAIELIKRNSRRYAKRQFTWFNNKLSCKWFNVDYANFSSTVEEVNDYIKKEY